MLEAPTARSGAGRGDRAGFVGRRLAMVLAAVILVAGCGSTPSPSTAASSRAGTATSASGGPGSSSGGGGGGGSGRTSPTAPASASPTSAAAFPVAVVTRFDDVRVGLSAAQLEQAAAAGTLQVPCELSGLRLSGAALTLGSGAACLPAAQLAAKAHATAGMLAVLPPGLVTPSIKVLQIDGADLFGSPTHRARAYPLTAAATTLASGLAAYDVNQVRTLISTGDTCPDRGVSYQANVLKKGWPWVLNGGTAHYTGFFEHPWGWPVPYIARNGDSGKVAALVADNDVSANDFECPMLKEYRQAPDTSTNFSIDPKIAPLLARTYGLKAVTLGSNHITDQGAQGVRETLQILDAAGIAHTGAGLTLAQALAPAIVNVRGLKFAFVGWDDIAGSGAATATRPGVAPLTDANVCSSLQAARKVADIVIAMPQWGWPEYHNDITKQQVAQRSYFYECGADDVLGSGTHWASWVSVLPGPNGPRFAIGSHGNFLFGQNWSRQTMEGVVVEATFYGTKLVQFRVHPYVVVDQAQPNLIDPLTDGKYVQNQVWSVSDVR